MNRHAVARRILWAALILAPLASICILGALTGTSPFSLDAWSSSYNDEQTYSSVVKQMRLYGTPQSMSGYNEVTAERLSWGTYTPVVFYPFLAGSFLTGISSHNFIYLMNMGFGVAAAALIVIMLRPTPRESAACLVLVLFQFIITRYLASGMSEASYVLFATFMACTCVWVVRKGKHGAEEGRRGGPTGRHTAARRRPSAGHRIGAAVLIVLVSVAIAFWGVMRPYLLAFVLVPIALLLGDTGHARPTRAVLAIVAVAATVAGLAAFMYFSNHYVAPYFEGNSIGSSLGSLVASALGNLASLHVEAVKFTGRSLLKLGWVGIMTAWFALEWAVLAVMAARSLRARDKDVALVQVAALLAGFAIFEANILLYYPRQLHRSLICCAVFYAILIIFLRRTPQGRQSPISAGLVLSVVIALLCTASVAVRPSEFAIPQIDPDFTIEQEDAVQAELRQLLPHADDPWDNTIAHPIENAGFKIYFCLPDWCTINCCQDAYLKDALKNGTLKCKYVSLPDGSKLKAYASRYEVVYEGVDHTIYRVH